MLIFRGLIRGVFNLALIGVFLSVPAGLVPGGTWYWRRALLFLGVYGFIMVVSIVALAVKAPASLEARLKSPMSKKQPVADRIVTSFYILWFLAWLLFIPIEVFCLKLLPTPRFAVSVCGGVLSLGGIAIVMTAIYQNSFAMPIVEDQSERGQVLVDTGLYARVRHPLYLGILPLFAGIALWLESYMSLIATSGILIILIARIVVEEKTLRKTLPGYIDYMEKVPYRLVPFIW